MLHFELHNPIQNKELDILADTLAKQIQKSITDEGRLPIDMTNVNAKGNRVILLFQTIVASESELKFSDDLDSVFGFLNAYSIFSACFTCFLTACHTGLTGLVNNIKSHFKNKIHTVVTTLNRFLEMDKPGTKLFLLPLLTFSIAGNIDDVHIFRYAIK